MKQKRIVVLVMIMGIFAFLFGCGKNKKPVDGSINHENGITNGGTIKEQETVITPIELPEGAQLTGLYMNRQGMAMEPYYILRTTDSGTYMKITTTSPDDYNMWKDEDTDSLEQPAEYFGFVETVKDVERASLVLLEEEDLIRQLEDIIVTYGALGWDGYSESYSLEGVLDGDMSYSFYLEFSDGTKVDLQSYNSCPAGFDELYSEVVEIFQSNSDYSGYMAKNFTDSPCTYLEVEFWDKEDRNAYYSLRLRDSSNQWSVTLNDPSGRFLEKGTDISEYKEMEEKLPFERFLNIMTEYQTQEWNGYESTDSHPGGNFTMLMYFEDGKEFEARGNLYPDGFEEFRQAFVEEIYDFYEDVK